MTAYEEVGTPANSGQVHPKLFTAALARLVEKAHVKIILGFATAINYNSSDSGVESVTYRLLKMVKLSTWTRQTSLSPLVHGPPNSCLQSSFLRRKGTVLLFALRGGLSPHILFTKIQSSGSVFSPDMYAHPADSLNAFDTLYSSGSDYYDVPLPDLSSEATVEADKSEAVWDAVKSVATPGVVQGELLLGKRVTKLKSRSMRNVKKMAPW